MVVNNLLMPTLLPNTASFTANCINYRLFVSTCVSLVLEDSYVCALSNEC